MKPAVREWIEKAEADFISAGREYRARKQPNFDAAGYRNLHSFITAIDFHCGGLDMHPRQLV